MEEEVEEGRRRADEYAVLLALLDEGQAGRPRLARLLGLGDRRTRNILARLRERDLVESSRAGARPTDKARALLADFAVERVGDTTLCLLKRPPRRLVSIVERNVVALRDAVSLILGSTRALLMIGLCRNGAMYAPAVPEDIVRQYLGGLECREDAVWALFRGERCYRCCGAFIQASAALSRSINGV